MAKLNINWTEMLLSNPRESRYLINWVQLTDSCDINRKDSYEALIE